MGLGNDLRRLFLGVLGDLIASHQFPCLGLRLADDLSRLFLGLVQNIVSGVHNGLSLLGLLGSIQSNILNNGLDLVHIYQRFFGHGHRGGIVQHILQVFQ